MKTALLGFTTTNLGDDLQAIATSLHLPGVDRIVDRDRLAGLRLPERHACVLQSWFSKQRWRAPSSAIDPIVFGFCLGSPTMVHGLWPRYLSRAGSIGARDTATLDKLRRMQVASYWSGCLTLRMGRFLSPIADADRSGVYMVDVHPSIESVIPEAVRAEAVRLSNVVPDAIAGDPLARMSQIAAQSDRLRSAALVITSRLHTALPCVGFGTSVVLIAEDTDGNRRRFSGFDEMLPIRLFAPGSAPSHDEWPQVTSPHIPERLDPVYQMFRDRIACTLGAVPEGPYRHLRQQNRLSIPNPGLGTAPGQVAIDLGMSRVVRTPMSWTANEIVVDVESFASFERFRCPVLVKASGSSNWVPVGSVRSFLQNEYPPSMDKR